MRLFIILFISISISACGTIVPNLDNNLLGAGQASRTEMTAQNLYNMAEKLYANKDYIGAYTLYARSLEKTEGDISLENATALGQANCLLRLTRLEDALVRFDSLSAMGINSAGVKEGQIESHLRLGHVAVAREKLNMLGDDELSSVRIHTLEGILYDLELEHEQARHSYEKAMALGYDTTASITNLALSYALTGDFETSRGLINSIDVNDETIALLYAIEGDLEMASNTITRSFHQRGLGATAVEQNMRYYEALADLSALKLAKAVLLGIVEE